MYKLNSERAKKLIAEKEVRQKIREKHVLLGRSGIFSFDEDEYFYAIMDRGEKKYLMHLCRHKNEYKKGITSINKQEAELLTKIGLEPFMRLDIERYVLESDIEIEKVKQLGYYVNREDLGLEEVFYGDLLRDKMSEDSDFRKDVLESAKSIL